MTFRWFLCWLSGRAKTALVGRWECPRCGQRVPVPLYVGGSPWGVATMQFAPNGEVDIIAHLWTHEEETRT